MAPIIFSVRETILAHKRIDEWDTSLSSIASFSDAQLDALNVNDIEEGTHNFLDSEFQQRNAYKRLEEGTHNFLGKNHPMKRLSKEGRHPSTLKRLKGEWCYIIAVSRFYYEIHDYTLKRRAEFLSKDIPDLSNAEQEYLF